MSKDYQYLTRAGAAPFQKARDNPPAGGGLGGKQDSVVRFRELLDQLRHHRQDWQPLVDSAQLNDSRAAVAKR